MSLTDPDARNRRIGSALRPLGWVLGILGVASAPIMVAIVSPVGNTDISKFVWVLFLYIGMAIGFGLLLYYTAAHRNALGIAAYLVAYLAGMILILGMVTDRKTGLPASFIPAVVVYAVAILLVGIYVAHTLAAHETLSNGIDTTATITSSGINGMVNYVSHWKLTLKFTDQAGKERWFHIGRTGGSYSVGQEFQIKYNPKAPGRGIVVLNG